MATVIGHVDHRRRPLVRLSFANIDDDVLGLLDTGFNGSLLVSGDQARRLQINERPLASFATMGDGRVVEVKRGDCTISWLGRQCRAEVLISTEPAMPAAPDDPAVLIGTQLLAPNLLMIDFAAGTVEIEASE